MGIKEYKKAMHWNYFIALERDIKNLSRYIEFDNENNEVFSIELVRILQIASSEIDVVLKLLCDKLNPRKKHKNINDYKNEIIKSLPVLIDEVIYASRYSRSFTPWINWKNGSNPIWWKAYNNVKHQRDIHFKDANLKNTLNAVAALYVITCYYYLLAFTNGNDTNNFRNVFQELNSESEIFKLKDNYYYKLLIAG